MWTDFFAASSGASAALAGLVFVALSVNIRNILGAGHLPSRAAATIGALMLILVCSMAFLIPQSRMALGAEIIMFSICGCVLQLRSAQQAFAVRSVLKRPAWEAALNAVLGQAQVLPFLVAGILLVAGRDRGVYWMAAGCMAIFIFSVLNAWVLLVEILR